LGEQARKVFPNLAGLVEVLLNLLLTRFDLGFTRLQFRQFLLVLLENGIGANALESKKAEAEAKMDALFGSTGS
jgi:hypothetical protein